MIGRRVEDKKTPDGFRWELWEHTPGWGAPTIYFAVHPITGERLLGGCVAQDPDEITQVMDLPR